MTQTQGRILSLGPETQAGKISINQLFSHPDSTVGSGVTPDHAVARGLTGEKDASSCTPPVGNLTLP